jgi:hypothetical protein
MSTPGTHPLHGGLAQPSSCVARRVVAHAKAAPARPAAALDTARDPLWITVASPIHLALVFCKILPKFELKTKFHQNKSYSEFYKLQNFFW